MQSESHILVVDDDEGVLLAARIALSQVFGQVETRSDVTALDDLIERHPFDAVLLDMNFRPGANSGQDGLEVLDLLHRLDPNLSIVMMTAYGGVALAVETLKRGATDFVLKPWQNEKLIATVAAAVSLTQSRREADTLRLRGLEASFQSGQMIGNAPEHQNMLRQVRRVAPTDANILILGETGTGRETVARELHRLSPRSQHPFVAVDIASVPEGLLESELFGHRRGAFPGADTERAGRLQAADGGTLYIEDVAALPFHVQRKLAGVLDRGEVIPLGAARPVPANVRFVAATHRSIAELEARETFHPGLLQRLRTVDIHVPTLRDRRDDIAALTEYFLQGFARRHNLPRRRLSPEVLRWLESYEWPGNVRELRQATERATLLVGDQTLRVEDFPFLFLRGAGAHETFDLNEIERDAIGRAMSHFNGNITLAATALGLTRPALYRRLEKHGFNA